MSRLRGYLRIVAPLGVAALLLAGCGGGESTASSTSSVAAKPQRRSPVAARGKAENCSLGAFLKALDTLESRLAVGLSYEQYYEEVSAAKSAYELVPVGALELPCLAAGAPGERALDKYIEAANVWRECRADASCATSTIEPRLQHQWRVASHDIALAHEGLA